MQIRAQHLTIGYGIHAIACDLNIEAQAGEMICLLGQNGCGKSTLLRTLCGLQPALKGTVTFGTQQVSETADTTFRSIESFSSAEKAQRIALVLTERLSIENTRVHDVVAMGRYPYSSFLGGLTSEDEAIIATSLEQVGMHPKANEFFNCLSDGEKQRVLIAKALAQQTPLILLDEPTAHLDLPNRIRILLLLRELAHTQGKCVIISTHELDLALQLADTIWLFTAPFLFPPQGERCAQQTETSCIPQAASHTTQAALLIGTPHELIASGAFAAAFANEHFSFENTDNQLRIRIKSSK